MKENEDKNQLPMWGDASEKNGGLFFFIVSKCKADFDNITDCGNTTGRIDEEQVVMKSNSYMLVVSKCNRRLEFWMNY